MIEMPTTCDDCGEVFDLNELYGGKPGNPRYLICRYCKERPEREEEDPETTREIDRQLSGRWEK
jgi:hypothetical protein